MRQAITGDPPTWTRIKQLEKKNSPDNDFVTDIDERVQGKTMPFIEEPCLAHPFNTSSVKIRNNGMIDMFVSTNQGIRIDPGQKTISIITNGQKEDLGYFHAWINNFAHWFVSDEIWHVAEKGNYRVDAGREIEIVAETYLYNESIEEMGLVAGKSLNTESIQDTNIGSHDKINASAAGDINIMAGAQPKGRRFRGDTIYKSSAANAGERQPGAEKHSINKPQPKNGPADMNLGATRDVNINAPRECNINASRECNINAGIGRYNGVEISTVQDDANVLSSANQYTDEAIKGVMDYLSDMDPFGP